MQPLLTSILLQADSGGKGGGSLLKFITGGGIIGYIIVLLSVVAVAFVVIHFVQIRRSALLPGDKVKGVRELVERGDLEGALAFALHEGIRVHADVPNVFGHREEVILGVADFSAAARDLLEHAAGLQGFRSQTRGVDPMQPDQPCNHGQEAEGNDPSQQTVARSPGVGQAHRERGPPCPPQEREAISRAVIRGLAESMGVGDATAGK